MAEPNISLLGATYSGVKGVTLPKSGGGTATFPWVEGSETKTANGTYDVTNLAELVVNVSGGGGSGLVYETGTYKPTSDVATPTINFANTHTSPPFMVLISDTTGTVESANSMLYWAIYSWYYLFGVTVYGSSSAQYYARSQYGYKTSSSISQSGSNINSTSTLGRCISATMFKTNNGTSQYFMANKTYKWIAVWKS